MLRLSSKQKQEAYSIFNLLLHLIIFIALLLSLPSCGLISPEAGPATCNTYATVKDLRGLDGCGITLVLDDGQQLQPVYTGNGWCGTPTPGPQTALAAFNFVDGKRIRIGYQEVSRATACMAGKTIEITCITETGPGSEAD